MTRKGNEQRGMTLLEVMVALVIFSTAAIALMNSVSLNVRYTYNLGENLQAGWVAENQLAESLLEKSPFPDALQEGTESMGGREWRWRKQRVNGDEQGMLDQIEVYSVDDDSQPVITLRVAGPEEKP